jgi:Zn finger protein HypA/HybF involved in hydrogenase expression
MAQPYDRPAREPGGCECIHCNVIFIGEEWHTECAVCHAQNEARLKANRERESAEF